MNCHARIAISHLLLFCFAFLFFFFSLNGQTGLNFTLASFVSAVNIPNNWFHGWMWPTPEFSLLGVHKPDCLSLCRRRLILKARRQLIYVSWKKNKPKKRAINYWWRAQITTCSGCGSSPWPEVAGLSVPWIYYNMNGLVANMNQGISHTMLQAEIDWSKYFKTSIYIALTSSSDFKNLE